MTNNMRRVRVLFDFEAMIDMKAGLILYMKEMFENAKDNPETKSKVNLDRLYSDFELEEDIRAFHMYGGEDIIRAVLLGEAAQQYKSITSNFFLECYEGIMNRAPYTSMVKLFRNYQTNEKSVGGVKPSILCTTELQQKFCKRYFQSAPIVMAEERSKCKLSDYGTIVIPYIEMLPEFGLDIHLTNIYILNYVENFEDTDATLPLTKYAIAYGDDNAINIYDAYSDLQPPVG